MVFAQVARPADPEYLSGAVDDPSDTMMPESDEPVVYTPPARRVIVIDDDAPDGLPVAPRGRGAKPSANAGSRSPELGPAAPTGKTVGLVVGGVLAVAALNVYLLDRARTPAEPDPPVAVAAAALPSALPHWLHDEPEAAIVPPAESVEAHADEAGLEDIGGGSEDGDTKGDAPKDKSKRGGGSSGGGKAPSTVLEAVSAGCSTASVDGLSRQIIAEGRCIDPDAFAPVPSRKNLTVGSQVFLYLEAPARDALLRVLDANPSKTLVVNSALRTIAQQFLLSKWGATKKCGVELAAVPGESNHESGLALDVREPGTWRPLLEPAGFRWLGPTDKVHFDYRGPGSVDHTGKDVLAFQRLWNRNHADDPINLTGHFDAETEARMKKSPPGGFPIGAKCGKPESRPVASSQDKAAPKKTATDKPASDKKKSGADTKKKKSGGK